MKIAFIGVGQMGYHLAASVLRAGHELTVCDLDRQAAEGLLARGATWAETPASAAAEAAVVITCLPSPGSVAEVVDGEHGILRSLRPGGVWIDMSTNERHVLEALAAAVAEHGSSTLEAPVSGNLPGAAKGEILVMVGGDEAVFEAQRPVLEAIGNPVFYVGGLGKATVIKLITNMLAFVHLVACGEALMLAKQGGIDLAQAYEVIRASSGNSVIHETNGQLILNGSYNIGFTLELALKDFGFIDALGQELGVPLDLASVTRQTFLRAKSEYGGDAWMTKVVKLLEDAVGTDLRADGFPAVLGG